MLQLNRVLAENYLIKCVLDEIHKVCTEYHIFIILAVDIKVMLSDVCKKYHGIFNNIKILLVIATISIKSMLYKSNFKNNPLWSLK